jgi:hypothetical protein
MCVDCDTSSEESICDLASSCPGYGENMIINPCQSCPSHVSTFGELSFAINYDILYPIILNDIIATPNKNSIEVLLNVSKIGYVYCAAFSENTTFTSVLNVKQAGYFSTIFNMEQASSIIVNIYDLNPSSTYDVYCYTEDFDSHSMDLESVLITGMGNINTLCCLEISMTVSNLEIIEYDSSSSSTEDIFEFLLETIPLEDTIAIVSLKSFDCNMVTNINSSIATAYPSSFEFTSSSNSLNGRFIIRGTPGCYYETVSIFNGTYYQNSTNSLTILSNLATPASPKLSTSIFGNIGQKIYLTFDSSTDQHSGLFNCSNILSFVDINYASCLWTSDISIIISLGFFSTINIGDSIELLGGKIKPRCSTTIICDYNYANSTSTVILPPLSAIIPTVSLSTSKTISTCDDIVLDPTRSSGTGGRNWLSIVWSVTDDLGIHYTSVENSLNANYSTNTFNLIKISSFLTNTGTYHFSLTLKNFLLKSSMFGVSTIISGLSSTPYVSIPGPANLYAYRNNSISIFSSASLPSCPGVAQNKIYYTWEIYKGTSFQSELVSISRDPRYFKLDSYTLDSNSVYTAVVTVNTGINTNFSSTSIRIEVGYSGVSALIKGGASRIFSSTSSISLDASSSYDIDYPTDNTLLSYSWTCSEINPNFGNDCPSLGISMTTSVLIIPALQLESSESKIYLFEVFAIGSSGLKSSTTTAVTVVSEAIPIVSIDTTSLIKFNSDEKIILSGSIISIGNGFTSWFSSDFDNSELDIISLTSLSKEIKAGTMEFQLAISANSLTPGLIYTFQLGATYGNSTPSSIESYQAASVILFQINESPNSGSITISPSDGTAFSTEFLISTQTWSDDGDLPLTYVLSYSKNQKSQNIVKNRDETSYVTTKLGQGLDYNDYIITCSATAIDNLGSISNSVTTTVKVIPNVDTAAVATEAVNDIANALEDNDPTAVTQVVGAVMSSLNSVNCTVPVDCYSINRESCSETDRTCGVCLAEYPLGESGDSNIPCRAITVRRRLIENEGSICTNNDECLSAYCNTNGICSYQAKLCSNDCSNNGDCNAYDYYNHAIEVDSCLSNDSYCRVECNCNDNWYGDDCSQNEVDFNSALSLRESLCVAVYDTVAIQDVTIDVVLSRATSIADIILYTTELTSYALSNCTSALVQTIDSYPEISGSSSTASLCLTALSRVVEKKSNFITQSLIDDVSNSMLSLSYGIQSNLAIGEDVYVLNEPNVRLGTSLVDVSVMSSTLFSTPLTLAEEFDLEIPTLITFPNYTSRTSTSVAVSLFKFNNNPMNLLSDSIIVGLQLNDYTIDESTRRLSTGDSFILETQVVLLNNYPIDYYKENYMNGSVVCDRLGSYLKYITCPSGFVMEFDCTDPYSYERTYDYYCPYVTSIPKCTIFDGNSFIVDSNCEVIDYNSSLTICDCSIDLTATNLIDSIQQYEALQFGSITITNSTLPMSIQSDMPTHAPTIAPYVTPLYLILLATILPVLFILIMFYYCYYYVSKEKLMERKKRFVNYLFPPEEEKRKNRIVVLKDIQQNKPPMKIYEEITLLKKDILDLHINNNNLRYGKMTKTVSLKYILNEENKQFIIDLDNKNELYDLTILFENLQLQNQKLIFSQVSTMEQGIVYSPSQNSQIDDSNLEIDDIVLSPIVDSDNTNNLFNKSIHSMYDSEDEDNNNFNRIVNKLAIDIRDDDNVSPHQRLHNLQGNANSSPSNSSITNNSQPPIRNLADIYGNLSKSSSLKIVDHTATRDKKVLKSFNNPRKTNVAIKSSNDITSSLKSKRKKYKEFVISTELNLSSEEYDEDNKLSEVNKIKPNSKLIPSSPVEDQGQFKTSYDYIKNSFSFSNSKISSVSPIIEAIESKISTPKNKISKSINNINNINESKNIDAHMSYIDENNSFNSSQSSNNSYKSNKRPANRTISTQKMHQIPSDLQSNIKSPYFASNKVNKIDIDNTILNVDQVHQSFINRIENNKKIRSLSPNNLSISSVKSSKIPRRPKLKSISLDLNMDLEEEDDDSLVNKPISKFSPVSTIRQTNIEIIKPKIETIKNPNIQSIKPSFIAVKDPSIELSKYPVLEAISDIKEPISQMKKSIKESIKESIGQSSIIDSTKEFDFKTTFIDPIRKSKEISVADTLVFSLPLESVSPKSSKSELSRSFMSDKEISRNKPDKRSKDKRSATRIRLDDVSSPVKPIVSRPVRHVDSKHIPRQQISISTNEIEEVFNEKILPLNIEKTSTYKTTIEAISQRANSSKSRYSRSIVINLDDDDDNEDEDLLSSPIHVIRNISKTSIKPTTLTNKIKVEDNTKLIKVEDNIKLIKVEDNTKLMNSTISSSSIYTNPPKFLKPMTPIRRLPNNDKEKK